MFSRTPLSPSTTPARDGHSRADRRFLRPATLSVACFGLACALLLPREAFAEPREYGPQSQRFTLDVPAGWTEKPLEKGVQLVAPEDRCAVSVRVMAREGKRAEALVNKAARDLSVSGITRVDDNTWSFIVASENTRVRNTLVTVNDSIVLVSVGGDFEAAKPVVNSLKPRE